MVDARDAAVGAVRQLGDTLHAAITRVDTDILETKAAIEQVSVEVKEEVQSVAASVSALEKRMAPIESDVHRSAQGIDVLCQLVATSGLLANASADSLRQLDDFTGAVTTTPTRTATVNPKGTARVRRSAQTLARPAPPRP